MPKARRRKKTRPQDKIRLTLDVDSDLYELITLAAMKARMPKAKWMRKAIMAYAEQVKVEVER